MTKLARSLATQNPQIASEWSNKNVLGPDEVFPTSLTVVTWTCSKCKQSWDAKVKSRHQKNSGCPYCSGRRATPGINDLQTLKPDLAVQWSSKNSLGPEKYKPQSNVIVWWICSKGHEWKSSVCNRYAGKSCPICVNRTILIGYNDLSTTSPELAAEWSKKNTLLPTEATISSNKQVLWVCQFGHEWETPINARSSNKSGCPFCSGLSTFLGLNDIGTICPELIPMWSELNVKNYTDYSCGSNVIVWWKCDEYHVTQSSIKAFRISGCSKCSNNRSKGEKDLNSFIEQNIETVTNDTTILSGRYEVDIYVPEKKIAIEFNGLYWHTENQGKNQYYHYNKWKMCNELGIQLITIWEDDWRDRQEIVKNMLAHKLGFSSSNRVNARNCTVTDLTFSQSSEFLNKYHIQGSVSGSLYLGLYDLQNILVGVAVFKSTNHGTYLSRYATSCIVRGGMSKILKPATNIWNTIYTFADLCVSDGSVYANTGWTQVKQLKPDYKYVVREKRHHKFKYRLKKFKDDPSLKFYPEMTEKELAILNHLPRIWDCGKIKYQYTKDKD